MEIEIGRGKKARRAYGFDDIAIVPSRRTRDPDDIDISWKLGPYQFELPMLASAMDGVVSPRTAGIIGGLGGLAVLNLEGIFTRYEDAEEQLERIASLPKEIATREMQEIYAEPIKPELIAQRIAEIKEQKVVVAASLTPQRVLKYHEIAMEAEEIRLMPEVETEELALVYEAKGVKRDEARRMATEVMKDPQRALAEKVREELKIGAQHSTPMREGWITGTATAVGAFIPVAPFLLFHGASAIWTAFAVAMVSHFGVGAARSVFTGRGIIRSGLDMFVVGLGVAGVGYLAGNLLAKLL